MRTSLPYATVLYGNDAMQYTRAIVMTTNPKLIAEITAYVTELVHNNMADPAVDDAHRLTEADIPELVQIYLEDACAPD